MRVLLITPKKESMFLKKVEKVFYLPRLTMPVIAALTPSDIEVFVIDENIEEINYDMDIDLVGITTWTSTALEAYKIADEFRARNITVVMGGIHVSALPEEALEHADAVVVGEAENVWSELIENFKNSNLHRIYNGSEYHPDLVGLPFPKRNLLKSNSFLRLQSVQATRGCPFSCDFCSVTTFFGKTYRFRPIKEVIRDVETTQSKLIFFVDDNIVGNIKYAEKLFTELIPLRKKWVGQSTLTITNSKILNLAAKSGCIGLLIGFESLHGAKLKKFVNKTNLERWYTEETKKIHDRGIGIDASMIIGFDDDDSSMFERTVEFCIKAKMDLVSYHILTPYPGTPLYNRLNEQHRLLHKNWSKYDENHVVFRPARMSIETLENGFYWMWKEFYSLGSVLRRLRRNMTLKAFFYLAVNFPYYLDTHKVKSM